MPSHRPDLEALRPKLPSSSYKLKKSTQDPYTHNTYTHTHELVFSIRSGPSSKNERISHPTSAKQKTYANSPSILSLNMQVYSLALILFPPSHLPCPLCSLPAATRRPVLWVSCPMHRFHRGLSPLSSTEQPHLHLNVLKPHPCLLPPATIQPLLLHKETT